MMAFINYKWAKQMTQYPLYSFKNGVVGRVNVKPPTEERFPRITTISCKKSP